MSVEHKAGKAAVEKLLRVLVAGGVALAGAAPLRASAEETAPAPSGDRRAPDPSGESQAGKQQGAERAEAKARADAKAKAEREKKEKEKEKKPSADEGGGVKGW